MDAADFGLDARRLEDKWGLRAFSIPPVLILRFSRLFPLSLSMNPSLHLFVFFPLHLGKKSSQRGGGQLTLCARRFQGRLFVTSCCVCVCQHESVTWGYQIFRETLHMTQS